MSDRRIVNPPMTVSGSMNASGGFGGLMTPLASGSSGLGDASAASLSGPFLVSRQTMDFDYVRVPRGKFVSQTVNLSAASIKEEDAYFYATYLQLKGHASVTHKKVDMVIDPSASLFYQQPQKFKLYAFSSDPSGQTYGDISGLSGMTKMGPTGSVKTSQEFYQRIPYNASAHDHLLTSNDSKHFYNTTFVYSGDGGHWTVMSAEDYLGDFDASWESSDKLNKIKMHSTVYPDFHIPGKYSTDAETGEEIAPFIVAVGNNLETSGFYEDQPTPTEVSWGLKFTPSEGVANFDTSRFDFSND